VEGPIAGRLLRTFRKSWYAWTREVIAIDESADPHAPAGLPAIPLFVDSGKGRRRLRRLLYYSINRAERSITLTTAYFTPSRRMVETLENAVTRGVRVQLLVPGMSDVPAASYAGMASFTRLLKAGVEIYRYTGEILHAKTYIFDECWSIIGSTNLDFQSLRYNDEGNVGILDHELGAAMTRIFNEDLTRSTKTDLAQWRMRPLGEKLKEHFFSLFRRRL
jgi:cardiolipin synthase